MPTVYVVCDVCNSTRYMKETLDVRYKGKNIYDVLQMTVEEAEEFLIALDDMDDTHKVFATI